MDKLGAFALTEPDRGPDSVALETSARPDPAGGWALNGRKRWIGPGTVADLVVVRPAGMMTPRPMRWPGRRSDEAALVFRGTDGGLTYVEIFTWVDGGFAQAHEHPDVLAIWEPMDTLLEDRDGLPRWEFPHFEQVTLAA